MIEVLGFCAYVIGWCIIILFGLDVVLAIFGVGD